jgi:hypothetical protein
MGYGQSIPFAAPVTSAILPVKRWGRHEVLDRRKRTTASPRVRSVRDTRYVGAAVPDEEIEVDAGIGLHHMVDEKTLIAARIR